MRDSLWSEAVLLGGNRKGRKKRKGEGREGEEEREGQERERGGDQRDREGRGVNLFIHPPTSRSPAPDAATSNIILDIRY